MALPEMRNDFIARRARRKARPPSISARADETIFPNLAGERKCVLDGAAAAGA